MSIRIDVSIFLDDKLMIHNSHNFMENIRYEIPLARELREVDSNLVLYGYKIEPLYFKVGEN